MNWEKIPEWLSDTRNTLNEFQLSQWCEPGKIPPWCFIRYILLLLLMIGKLGALVTVVPLGGRCGWCGPKSLAYPLQAVTPLFSHCPPEHCRKHPCNSQVSVSVSVSIFQSKLFLSLFGSHRVYGNNDWLLVQECLHYVYTIAKNTVNLLIITVYLIRLCNSGLTFSS